MARASRSDKGLPGKRGGDLEVESNISGSTVKSSITGLAKPTLLSLLVPDEELDEATDEELETGEEVESDEELDSEEELESDVTSLFSMTGYKIKYKV